MRWTFFKMEITESPAGESSFQKRNYLHDLVLEVRAHRCVFVTTWKYKKEL